MTEGHVANLTRLFAYRPEVYRAWRQLNAAIKANIDPRRYELATLAAGARRLFSTVLDAMGVEPDAAYRTLLEPELREALTVGRPVALAEAATPSSR